MGFLSDIRSTVQWKTRFGLRMDRTPGYEYLHSPVYQTGRALMAGGGIFVAANLAAFISANSLTYFPGVHNDQPAVISRMNEARDRVQRAGSTAYTSTDMDVLEERIQEYRVAAKQELHAPEAAYYRETQKELSSLYGTVLFNAIGPLGLGSILITLEGAYTRRKRREVESPQGA